VPQIMPDIQAFRGLRYDLGHVGSLADVVAPPYDVIDSDLQSVLYKQHPANVIRLILNRHEPGDDDANNCYARAARFLKNWIGDGVLQTEPDPAVYVYHQMFEYGGAKFTRRGVMCGVRLERFGEGSVYPHEETHPAAKADRLKLTTACQANLSPIFGLYPDPQSEAQNLLEAAIAGRTPLEATDHLGIVHRLWPVTDVKVITEVTAAMSGKPTFVADGHHRYETACNYRDQIAGSRPFAPSHPANHVLMMCVGMSDPGMIVLPTHRLFRGMPNMSSAELIEMLGDCFAVQVVGQGSDLAKTVWQQIEAEDQQGTIGLFAAKDEQWLLVRITDAGRTRMAEVAQEHSADWQSLGVSILHRLIVDTLLGAAEAPQPMYVRAIDEVVEALTHGDSAGRDATGQQGQGGRFHLAALVMPATVEHVRAISQQGERMPAKSTYFYPKLLSGLVIRPLK